MSDSTPEFIPGNISFQYIPFPEHLSVSKPRQASKQAIVSGLKKRKRRWKGRRERQAGIRRIDRLRCERHPSLKDFRSRQSSV